MEEAVIKQRLVRNRTPAARTTRAHQHYLMNLTMNYHTLVTKVLDENRQVLEAVKPEDVDRLIQ
jgi:hypothetical protein